MHHSEASHYGPTVILSFLVGTLAGAAAVFFLARKARRESADRIKEFSNDLKEQASANIDTAKEKLSSAVSRGRDFPNEKRSVIESALEAGKDAYAQGKSEAAQSGVPRA